MQSNSAEFLTHRDAINSDARQQVPAQEAEGALRSQTEAVAGDGDRDNGELGHELDARQNCLEAAHDARQQQILAAALPQLLLRTAGEKGLGFYHHLASTAASNSRPSYTCQGRSSG